MNYLKTLSTFCFLFVFLITTQLTAQINDLVLSDSEEVIRDFYNPVNVINSSKPDSAENTINSSTGVVVVSEGTTLINLEVSENIKVVYKEKAEDSKIKNDFLNAPEGKLKKRKENSESKAKKTIIVKKTESDLPKVYFRPFKSDKSINWFKEKSFAAASSVKILKKNVADNNFKYFHDSHFLNLEDVCYGVSLLKDKYCKDVSPRAPPFYFS